MALQIFVKLWLAISWLTQCCFAHDKCPQEFVSLQDSCLCDDTREGWDVWCTNSESPEARFHLSGRSLWVTCHDIDEIGLNFYMQNISFSSSPKLTSLVFTDCQVPSGSYSAMLALANIEGVEELRVNMGYAQDNALIAGQFTGVNVEHIRLSNNHLKSLDKDTFQGLGPSLKSLVMSSNGLEELPSGCLQLLVNLRRLEIIEPKVKEMPTNLLSSLTELVDVRMSCPPQQLNPDFFAENEKLVSLRLKNFDASDLDPMIFRHLSNLENITVSSGRSISSLPLNLFQENGKLRSFEWINDKCAKGQGYSCTVHPPSFLRNLSELRSLEISKGYHQGFVINPDFFQGCTQLRSISLTRIRLRDLPSDLFEDAVQLQRLDLSNNRLTILPDTLFHKARSLQWLNLKGNSLTMIKDDHFISSGSSLLMLDLSDNALMSLSQKAFDQCNQLENLNLSNNQLSFNSSTQPLWRAMTRLQVLNLSNNSITLSHIPQEFRTSYTQLRELNLRMNDIGPRLDAWPDFVFQSNQALSVDLSHNNLQHLSYFLAHQHVQDTHSRHTLKQVKIHINHNPLICDCRNVDLALDMRDKLTPNVVTSWFQYQPGATCHTGELLKLKQVSEMSCSFPSDFVPHNCSEPCSCLLTPYQSETDEVKAHVTVNCSGHSHLLPQSLPLIVHQEEVKKLTLDLSHGGLESLENLTQIEHYDNVTELIISHNNLTHLSGRYLPSRLEEVAFDHNRIRTVDIRGDLSILRSNAVKSIKLGGNPYECNCNSRLLYRFVRRNAKVRVQDADQVWLDCYPDGPRAVNNISEYTEFCTNTKQRVYEIAIPVGLILLGILLAIVCVLWNKEKISVYIYSKPAMRALVYNAEEENDKRRYDVFISYANEDKEFVEQKLVPILEDSTSEYKYRCLVHVRDFIPGDQIMDQIVNAVTNSTRTLIVLSQGFLQSNWALQE